MTLDDATFTALGYASDWSAQLFAAAVREAFRVATAARPTPAQRKRYDAAYRAKRKAAAEAARVERRRAQCRESKRRARAAGRAA